MRATVSRPGEFLSALLWAAAVLGHLIWPAGSPAVWLSLCLPLLGPPFLLAYERGPAGAGVGVLVGWLLLGAGGILVPALLDRSVPAWPVAAVASVLACEGAGAAWIVARLEGEASRAVDLALVDPVTGLPNRRVLELFLEKEVERARRGRELTVALLGVDGLGRVNRELGWGAGDDCLRALAQALEGSARDMDVLGRFEGDLFLVVLSGERGLDGVRCADRLRRRVPDAVLDGGRRLTVTAGVAAFLAPMASARDLLEAADRAMRAGKAAGGDRVVLADPSLSAADLEEADAAFWFLEQDLSVRHVDPVPARPASGRPSPSRNTASPGI